MQTRSHHEELAAVPMLLTGIAILWVRIKAAAASRKDNRQ